jgi:hypothetical protein
LKALKKTVRRQIQVALLAARGNPADRARPDDGVERIVRQAVAL